MDKTLQIRIGTKREILALAYRELSDIAQRAVADGKSLYDAIIPHSNDVGRMCSMVDDAVTALADRLRLILDEVNVKPNSEFFEPEEDETEAGGMLTRLFISTPELPGAGTIAYDIRMYCVMYIVAQMVRERDGQLAEQYGTICASRQTLVVEELHRRAKPMRS